jgi:hypothetical protein
MAWLDKLFVHRKSDENAYARKLYETIVEYSKIKATNERKIIAIKDANSEREFDNLLEYCAILYEPDNCHFYVEFDEKRNTFMEKNEISVPDYLPADYKLLVENCTGLCYSMMLGMLSEQYLASYPRFEEMEDEDKIEQLCLEECMQFFLYYNRLSLRKRQIASTLIK